MTLDLASLTTEVEVFTMPVVHCLALRIAFGDLCVVTRHLRHQVSNLYPIMNFRLSECKGDIVSCEVFDQHNSDEEQDMKYFLLWKFLFLICTSAAAAKSLQSCPTPCDPIGSSPPGSPVPGILQARTLEWVAISFSNA